MFPLTLKLPYINCENFTRLKNVFYEGSNIINSLSKTKMRLLHIYKLHQQ